MLARYPTAHIIPSRDVTYTRHDTHLYGFNPSAHTELKICSPIPRQHTSFKFITVDSTAAHFRIKSGTVPPAHIFSWLVKKWFVQPYSSCPSPVMSGLTDALKWKDAGHPVCSYIRNGLPVRTHICSLLIHPPSGVHIRGRKYNILPAHIFIWVIN